MGLELNPLLDSEYTIISVRMPRALVVAIDEYAGTGTRNTIIVGTLMQAFPNALPEGWTYRGHALGSTWRGKTAPRKVGKCHRKQ